mgnify:CR=1 FL=1
MKLSNFELVETKGKSFDLEFFALVDVETGVLFWKKKERRMIRRRGLIDWHFVDNGKFAPIYQARELARAWEAQTGQVT